MPLLSTGFLLFGLFVLLYVGIAAGTVLASGDRTALLSKLKYSLLPAAAVPMADVFFLVSRLAGNFLGNYDDPYIPPIGLLVD